MNPDLKDLLDDAAASALGPRSLDAHALLERGRARRRHTVVRRGVNALAVAAVIALMVVLLPVLRTAPPQPAQPTSGQVGLPRLLPLPTPWTPTITQSPIERASLLLRLDVTDPDWGDGDVDLVLSADGRTYRRLQVPDASLELTDDGRYVVYTVSTPSNEERPHTVLHVLRLADGKDRAVALPDGGLFSTVDRVVLSPDSRTAYVVGTDGTAGSTSSGSANDITWKVDLASGRVQRVAERPIHITRNGTMYAFAADAKVGKGRVLPLPAYFENPIKNGDEPLVSSPDGRRLAVVKDRPWIGEVVRRDGTGRTTGFVLGATGSGQTLVEYPIPDEDEGPRLRGWTEAGLLFVDDDGLRRIDLDTRKVSRLTTIEQPGGRSPELPDGGPSVEISEVADDVARTGVLVAGPTAQDEPPWIVRLLRSPDGVRPSSMAVLIGVLGLLGLTLLQLRRRRTPTGLDRRFTSPRL